ncbi:MAG: DMT family transporter, partial [Marinilabiliales bacterium]|nr:DMT family transporter [Marinilabiliales bacterium]
MHLNHAGELSGILTAVCWTVAAMTFSVATRKAGALTVNLFRLIFAMMMYMVWSRLTRGLWFPSDASPDAWKWLSVSGFIGFVLGDYCLFSSYAYQPAKISMLVMSLAPPIATLFGVVLLHETITVQNFLGMALVLSGIAIVILKREEGEKLSSKFNYPVKGLLLALGGAAGQGIGAVFSKMGMQDYDPFASSQIRTITGIIGFTLLITITRNWKQTKDSLLQTGALKPLIAG